MRKVDDMFVASGVIITGDVHLSPGVNIWYGSVIRGDVAQITIESYVNLQDGCIVHCDRGKPQLIEAGVVAGHRAILHGKRIGAGSLIGMGAILLSGCEIGNECIIAAGSVVTEGKRIPPRSLVVGAPGKVVRQVTSDEVEQIRQTNRHYLDLAQRYVRGEIAIPLASPVTS
ncbi:MAG TPA: gamma carbonic anhydrase family protein [Gemmataceae bacterium]|jgi:carbonic anhydrase/acetyltransferase-like protein (isoleucine patch superfamily)|nr:gamma carbonic anhydrase family protein [Gemmataceae bacterium]